MTYRPYKIFACIFALAISACTSSGDEPLKMISSPAAENSHLPYLTSDSSGSVFLSWVETQPADNSSQLFYAKLHGQSWSKSQKIAANKNWFVNWADYPTILAQNGDLIAAHALKKTPGNTYSYNVNIYLNQKNRAWSSPFTPHFDSTATEHGFVSLAPWNDKTLAIWLDGRRTHNRSETEYDDITKAMTLRSAVIDPAGRITQKMLVDDSVCDCCNTSIARTPEGAIAAYRNRTDQEVRDIYVSRYADGRWSTPKAVYNDHWKISACPVNGPAIAARDSFAVVAWYTAANNKGVVKAAFSTDFGKTFSDPIQLNGALPAGRVDAAVSKKGQAFVSWLEGGSENMQLKFKRISADGTTSPAVAITDIDAARESGFPQMEIANQQLIFAWTEIDSTPSVKTAVYSVIKPK